MGYGNENRIEKGRLTRLLIGGWAADPSETGAVGAGFSSVDHDHPSLLSLAGDQTITGLKTFDRDPLAPFAVTAGSAAVSNLDADMVDGSHAADFQPVDAELTALAGLVSAADKLPYFTGSGTAALADLTAAGRAILDDADATAQRATLGLVIGSDVQAFDATLLSIASLGTVADRIPYTTGVDTWAETALTAAARTVLDDATTADMLTTLGAVAKSLFDAQTILAATADDTPAALTVGEQTIVGRITGGNVAALTQAQAQGLISPAWTSYSFSAGDFTGNGSMTWTVASGDVTNTRYQIVGKTMRLTFQFATTTVGGTPSTDLQFKIPGGNTAAGRCWFTFLLNDNGAGIAVGYGFTTGSGTNISFRKINTSAWSASTDNTAVFGEIFFDIS